MDNYWLLFFFGTYFGGIMIVILHELGHAIPALIFTNEPVVIYGGGNQKNKNKVSFRLGRLTMHLDVFSVINMGGLKGGLCYHGHTNKPYQYVIILFGGVAFTLIIAISLLFLAVFYELSLRWQMVCLILTGLAILDIFRNLIPSEEPIILENGEITYNDGYQIGQLLRNRKLNNVITLFNRKKYSGALVLFEGFKPVDYVSDHYYTIHMYCLQTENRYADIIKLAEEAEKNKKILSQRAEEMTSYAISLVRPEHTFERVENCLRHHPGSDYIRSMYAWELGMANRHEEAIEICSELIIKSFQLAATCETRALSLLMTERYEEAFKDLTASIALDDTTADIHRSMGIYYFKKGETAMAQRYLNKAYEIDPEVAYLDEYLKAAYKEFIK